MAEELRTSSTPPAAVTPPQQPQFAMDSSNISTVYTNFCHGTITPEELILDFGLNTQMGPNPNVPVKLTHRVVMNFYTAKRLLHLLGQVIAQHEATFGVLELDAQRRARGLPRTNVPPSALKPGPA